MKETMVKINKTKSWFFEKIKLTNIQPDSSRKKEKLNLKKLEMKVTAEIQCRNIKDYKRLLQTTMWK